MDKGENAKVLRKASRGKEHLSWALANFQAEGAKHVQRAWGSKDLSSVAQGK